MHRFIDLLLKLLCLKCFIFIAAAHPCHHSDHQALVEFSGNVNSGYIVSNWSNPEDCCTGWTGVTCSPAGNRVVKLSLSGRGLAGRLPDSFANFVQLEHLDISYNSLFGSISVVSGMSGLRTVNISSNFFNGSLPDLSNLKNLVYFNASNNSLYGPIGVDICFGCGKIEVVDLSANKFSGRIPAKLIANCRLSMRELFLGSNSLSGDVPDSVFELGSLQKFSISWNNISGVIDDRLGDLSELRVLIVAGNSLSGRIPDVFGSLRKLEQLTACSNFFSGTIPKSLGNCSKLRVLDARNNSLSGYVDVDFSGMPFLCVLDLASNHFVGGLPVSLSNCQELRTLSLAKNGLTGQVPEEFGSLVSLSSVSLSNNSFQNISGALKVLQNCRNLSTLILSKNFHGEEIPVDSLAFANLEVFALGNCGLRGRIPVWLMDCKKLQVLDISWNHLSGTVPSWIGQLDSLIYLDLSNNSLTGDLPKSLTELKSLISMKNLAKGISTGLPLYVKRNQNISGLQYNQLSSFPPSLCLNNNSFSGIIWPEFGKLKALHVLDLSRNNMSGIIPDTLGDMANLEVLDLSFNELTGVIPNSLSKLNFLSKFSVAYNNLEGEVPTKGQFFSFSNSSFDGNPLLCRSDRNCNNTQVIGKINGMPSRMRTNIRRGSILGITASIGVGIAILLAVILFNMSRKDAGDRLDDETEDGACGSSESGSNLVLFFQSDAKDLTINDLLKSTNNFDQANIIGCGGFGLVYKACLPDGTKAAIKRLSGDCGQMEREFRAEVEALSMAQHKNLVSLKGYCRYGDDRLLIYSFMENGSLDYWLHEKFEGSSLLKWEARLKIAQGSARGLAYLHKICEPNIIHRDVKSSNILLDERFEAHLADFGLSRLIRPYDTHVTTDLVGTLGYIPPEYSQTLIATLKGDVFSFGVVLLELLTGRRPVDVCKAKGCRDLVSWVLQMKSENKSEQIFDTAISTKGNDKQLLQVLDIACKCVNKDPRLRPSIDQVVSWLDSVGSDTDYPT